MKVELHGNIVGELKLVVFAESDYESLLLGHFTKQGNIGVSGGVYTSGRYEGYSSIQIMPLAKKDGAETEGD